MFIKLWNYIRGYVIINVEGYYLEKFINICLHRHIFMWNVEKISNRQMLLYLYIKDFFKIRPVVKKSKCHVSILKRCGIPFLFKRYKRRKAFAFGIGIFVLLLFFLTSFIWKVEITGNNKVDSSIIKDKLIEMGAKPGAFKAALNTESIADEMILGIKELSWVSVELKGTKLKVEVAERRIPPAIVPKNEPCDIYATKDGIIKSVVVKSGIEVVKAGATVKSGQLLVTGVVPNKNEAEPSRIVHAIANVKARTWYEKSIEIETKVSEKIYLDNIKYKLYIAFLDKKIQLIPGGIRFKEYEKTIEEKQISLGKDLDLPFSIIKEKYTEVENKEIEIPYEEAAQIALNKATEQIVEEIPTEAEIINTDSRYIDGQDGKKYAVLTVECIEDIGEQKKIGGK